MALPIINTWKTYYSDYHEGLGSSYERLVINKLLLRLARLYHVQSVLEVPLFGFTGISGINSIALSKAGCSVTLVDDNAERIDLISKVHNELKEKIDISQVDSYSSLPFEAKQYDMSWNFSALWFVDNLTDFLTELTRVTGKIILLCVPNQEGLGYKWQKANTDIPAGFTFNEANIDPDDIKMIMRNLNWKYIAEDYIDCPLWPDIGMNKEKFFGKYLSSMKLINKEIKHKKVVSIMEYYKDSDAGFPDKMDKYSFFEKYAPSLFKRYWSHHKWILFENKKSL